jgi:hypothetical protein
MPKIVDLHISSIKCDHCPWRNNDVKVEGYDLWLNKSCPNCGENLLTMADYVMTKKMLRRVKIINFLFGWLTYFPAFKELGEPVRIHGNGTGKVFVERKSK